MKSPKVSICIPAYKQPELLRQALRSVAEQTFRDFEVIITDDSPDDTVREVAGEFSGSFQINYFRNAQRLGSPENWNEAVGRSRGDYVKILHHDDWFFDEHSLRHFVTLLDQNPRARLGFGFTQVCTFGGSPRLNAPGETVLKAINNNPAELFFGNHIGAPSATIFRREAIEPFDRKLKWLVDIEFYIRLLQHRPELACWPQPLICTTDGAHHQVTDECMGNRDVEVYEWLYLYRLLDRRPFPSLRRVRRLIWVFQKIGIHSVGQLQPHLKEMTVPKVLALWMSLRHFARRTGLKN
jgi:glycosyltransferase involved in cell wall biosynthesis